MRDDEKILYLQKQINAYVQQTFSQSKVSPLIQLMIIDGVRGEILNAANELLAALNYNKQNQLQEFQEVKENKVEEGDEQE